MIEREVNVVLIRRQAGEPRVRATHFRVVLALTVALATLSASTACGPIPRTSSCSGRSTLTASGSSAQAEAMALFNRSYSEACRGHSVNYTSSDSATGRAEFASGETDFGGSDSPLGLIPAEAEKVKARCGGNPAWNLPMAFGAIAIIYNLPGVDSLVLDGPTTAKIFNGSIKDWGAPELAALNPGQSLPSRPIVVIARSDQSGTTENFQNYLATAAGTAWGGGIGETFTGVADESAKGNEGAWAALRRSTGSITYTAWPFAKLNDLPTARLVTSAGSMPVPLSVDSVTKSVEAIKIKTRGNDMVLDTSSLPVPTQPDAYPIVMATYEIVCSRYPDPEVGAAVKSFLIAAAGAGQNDLAESGYVPVPGAVRDRLKLAINAVS